MVVKRLWKWQNKLEIHSEVCCLGGLIRYAENWKQMRSTKHACGRALRHYFVCLVSSAQFQIYNNSFLNSKELTTCDDGGSVCCEKVHIIQSSLSNHASSSVSISSLSKSIWSSSEVGSSLTFSHPLHVHSSVHRKPNWLQHLPLDPDATPSLDPTLHYGFF